MPHAQLLTFIYLLLRPLPKPRLRLLVERERVPLPKLLLEGRFLTDLDLPDCLRVLLPNPEPVERLLPVLLVEFVRRLLLPKLEFPEFLLLAFPVVRKVVRFLTAAGGSL